MSSGICIMQTCTAMQLPTSRLGEKTKGTVNGSILQDINFLPFLLFVCIISIPQADVVLQCKLDPIDNLRKLRHHGQQRNTDEILHKYKEYHQHNTQYVNLLKMCPWF